MKNILIFSFILFFLVSCGEKEDYSNDTLDSHDYACLFGTDESYNGIMPCSLFDPDLESRAKNWKRNKIGTWIEE